MFTDAGTKYGMARVQLAGTDTSGAANGAVTSGQLATHSIENPMVWLIGIGAVTLGLVAFSTHVRIGAFKASASAGSG